MKKKVNWRVLMVCLVVVYSIAGIGSLLTMGSVNSQWYESTKPSITPPSFIFPIVWNILFFLIALSLYLTWINAKNRKIKSKIAIIFAINFILNILWSYLYFKLQNPLYAFYEIFILWLSILAMILATWKISRKSAYLLMPYLLWVSFAIILNYLSIK